MNTVWSVGTGRYVHTKRRSLEVRTVELVKSRY